MNKHPNATAAVGGGGLGVIVVWALGLAGVDVPPEVAAAIAGGLAGIVLFIGRRGVKGLASVMWRGGA